jgi:hypothetical protein
MTYDIDNLDKFDEKFYEGERNSVYCKAHKLFATPTELKFFILTDRQEAYNAGRQSALEEVEKELLDIKNAELTYDSSIDITDLPDGLVAEMTGLKKGIEVGINIIEKLKQ